MHVSTFSFFLYFQICPCKCIARNSAQVIDWAIQVEHRPALVPLHAPAIPRSLWGHLQDIERYLESGKSPMAQEAKLGAAGRWGPFKLHIPGSNLCQPKNRQSVTQEIQEQILVDI